MPPEDQFGRDGVCLEAFDDALLPYGKREKHQNHNGNIKYYLNIPIRAISSGLPLGKH